MPPWTIATFLSILIVPNRSSILRHIFSVLVPRTSKSDPWSACVLFAIFCYFGWCCIKPYSDIIMRVMASQITSISIVYSTICWGEDQRQHQNSVSLAFVRRIHWWPMDSPHKGPITWKMFPFDDFIMTELDFYHFKILTCLGTVGSLTICGWLFLSSSLRFWSRCCLWNPNCVKTLTEKNLTCQESLDLPLHWHPFHHIYILFWCQIFLCKHGKLPL